MTAAFPLAPALAHGACPRCTLPSRVVFHYTARCPFGHQGRERRVPCREFGCRRWTADDDAFCSSVCRASWDARVARRGVLAARLPQVPARDGVGASAGPGATPSVPGGSSPSSTHPGQVS